MRRAAAPAVLLALAAACAGVRTYPNDGPRNLRVLTRVESGVSAALRIYAVDPVCEAHDLGALALDRSTVDVGVAAGRPELLVVTFDTSSFLRGSRKMSVELLLSPRAAATYELAAKYANDMYEVSLFEIDRRGRRELPHRSLASCPH